MERAEPIPGGARTFERRAPGWLGVVPVVLAIGTVTGVRLAQDHRLFEGLPASDATLFALGHLALVYTLSRVGIVAWSCRRYGRCTVAAPSLTFETPLSQALERKAMVHFEDIMERVVTPHGVRVYASRVVSNDRKGRVHDLNRLERGIEALVIPSASGEETDGVLALLDAPWAPPSGS